MLPTCSYHSIVAWLHSNVKYKVLKEKRKHFGLSFFNTPFHAYMLSYIECYTKAFPPKDWGTRGTRLPTELTSKINTMNYARAKEAGSKAADLTINVNINTVIERK